MIPLGDIDLRHEIRLKDTGIVDYDRDRARVRRLYSAKIEGRKLTLTVAMYQGNGAEEQWRKDVAKYMSMRHPNIIQIYGAASSGGMHAAIFNDDLIPLKQFVDYYRDSPVLMVYIYACCNEDFAVRKIDLGILDSLYIVAGGTQLYLFCIPTNSKITKMYEMDTSLDWSALHRVWIR
ncbi:hypothetical protein B0H12DRAFT_1172646 [Mycena haematopus]|nr:hypothetical protein B0H12DRAFT_1172646 [Mycena haematopus]